MTFQVERVAMGSRGIKFQITKVRDSSMAPGEEILAEFKATAALDPVSVDRAEKRAVNKCKQMNDAERMKKIFFEVRQIVTTGKCPHCGEELKRNLSMAGWYQCAQLGAVGFRKHADKPSCNWQGFTE